MSQPEQSHSYDPSQALGHVISLLMIDDGKSDHHWNLLEFLAQTHGLGDVDQTVSKPASAGLGGKRAHSMLSAVARLQANPQTHARRTALLEKLLDAGANPWAAANPCEVDIEAGITVLKACLGSPAVAKVINHPQCPGWRAMAKDPYFRSLVRPLDRAGVIELLDAGMPINLSVNSGNLMTSRSGSHLLDICDYPDAIDALLERGAPVGQVLMERIADGKIPASPAFMERALELHGTNDGDALAAVVLKGALKSNHPGQISVGVVLCGSSLIPIVASAIPIVASVEDTQVRASGLSAIASAASRNALTLDDASLAAMCQIVQSISMEHADMSKVGAKVGMSWLGSRIEDLATRLASGQTEMLSGPKNIGPRSMITVAGLVSGILPVPWAPQWCPHLSPLERAERVLSRIPGSAIENIPEDVLSYWGASLLTQFNGLAPASFLKGAPGPLATWGGNASKWIQVTTLASNHVKAGGAIVDHDFVRNLQELLEHVKTSPTSQSARIQILEEQVRCIQSRFDQCLLQQSTPPAAATSRPSPRM